jgi:hypothetical protein
MRRRVSRIGLACCVAAVLALLVCIVASAGVEVYSGKDAEGLNYQKLRMSTVVFPYWYWSWTISPQGVEAAAPVNSNRYLVHHRMSVGGSWVEIARVDILHTTTATDTICFRIYNTGVVDSMVWISSTINQVSFPVVGDSINFKPYKTSSPGDWYLTTYFER